MSGTPENEPSGSSRRFGRPADRTRAQSVTIGALFVFAFLVLALAVVQTVFVPQENKQVEFNHNKEVQDDMVDLRSGLLRTAATGEARSSSVRLGTDYPSRTLLLNPPSPSGTLRTADRANISVVNAVASGGAGDYLDGGNRSFRTKAMVYQPNYNVYTSAPRTVFASSVIYERYPRGSTETTTPGSNQTVVNSRTISLVALRGSYYESGETAATVDPRVLSATNRTVTVTDDGDPIVLKLPTRLTEAQWRSLLSSELDPDADEPDRYVTDVSCDVPAGEPCGVVEITLERGVEYNLRMGAVGVGSRGEREAVTNEPWYVVATGGNGSVVGEDRTRRVTFEVRDRFNNPVPGATVAVAQPRTGQVTDGDGRLPADGTVELTSDRNGRVTVTYHAPLNVRRSVESSFTARLPGGSGEDRERVGVTLDVQDDADPVDDAEWSRPLVEVVEHTPDDEPRNGNETSQFVRVQVTEPGEYELNVTDADGSSGTVTFSPDAGDIPADGTLDYYFVDGSLEGPCRDEVGFSKSLPQVLDAGDTLRVVETSPGGGRDPAVRDRVTIRGSPDGNGTGTDFEPAGVGLRRVEDGAHVDSNRPLDWNTTFAANTAVCGESSGRMDVLFEDDFADGSLGPEWTGIADDPDGNGFENGEQGVDATVTRFDGAAYVGGNASETPSGDDSRIESTVASDTRDYDEVVVSFAAYDAGADPATIDADEELVVEYRTDRTGGWEPLGRVTPDSNDGTYLGEQTFRVERNDDPSAFATGFRVRLRQPSADTGAPPGDDSDRWYVDGVVVAAG